MRFLVSSCLLLTSVGGNQSAVDTVKCLVLGEHKCTQQQVTSDDAGITGVVKGCFKEEFDQNNKKVIRSCKTLSPTGNSVADGVVNSLAIHVQDCFQCGTNNSNSGAMGVMLALAALLI